MVSVSETSGFRPSTLCHAARGTTLERMNDDDAEGLTRREALAAALAGATTLAALPGCTTEVAHAGQDDPRARPPHGRMPVVYLPHGGGPWPFVDLGFGERAELDSLAAYLRSLEALPHARPRALLVVSA